MEMLIVLAIIIGAVGLFAVLSQGGNQQQALAVPSFAGGVLIIVAFFGLPWIRLTGIGRYIPGLSTTMLPPEITNQIGDPVVLDTIRDMLNGLTRVTGWILATGLPTVDRGLQFVLFFVLAAGLVALLGGVLAIAGGSAARILAMIQAGWCGLAAVLLFFAMGRIRTFGLDLGLVSHLLGMLVLSVGIGVWATLLGLLSGVGGGVLLLTSSGVTTRNGSRSHSVPTRRSHLRPGRR